MIPTEIARTVIAALMAAALVGLPVVAIGLVVGVMTGRLSDRGRRRLVRFGAILLGFTFGFGLLIAEPPAVIRVASIVGVLAGVVAAIWLGRLADAGWFVIASAIPWTLYAGSALLDVAVAGRRIIVEAALLPLFIGIGGFALGVTLIQSQRPHQAGNPAPNGPPGPPRRFWNAASQAILGPSVAGVNLAIAASIVCLIAGAQLSASFGHPLEPLGALAVVAVGSILTGVAATLAWVAAWPPRSRRAFEAFAWLGEWELERFRALAGPSVSPTLGEMKRYVRNTRERPEDRALRAEILAATGKLAEARAMTERIPDDTPFGRAERAGGLDFLDWLEGGSGDGADFRAAVEAIEPSDGLDRLRAEVALAMADVRRRVGIGQTDPAAPMRAVRARIGSRADRIWIAAGRRVLPGYLRMSTAFVVIVTVIDRAVTA